MAVFNEAGWWKLTHNKTPKQYYDYGLLAYTLFTFWHHIFLEDSIAINFSLKRNLIPVKRLRRDKGTVEEINITNDTPGPSLLGKRTHETSEDESSEAEPQRESDYCSRTL